MNNNESTQNQYTNDEILTKINKQLDNLIITNKIVIERVLILNERLRVKLKEEDNG